MWYLIAFVAGLLIGVLGGLLIGLKHVKVAQEAKAAVDTASKKL